MTAENVTTRQSESTSSRSTRVCGAGAGRDPLAVVVGFVRPKTGVALKPLGDAFIKLISMIITLVIFCTVVSGIAGMKSPQEGRRVCGKALLYFEVISTLALLIGCWWETQCTRERGSTSPREPGRKELSTYANQSSYQTTSIFCCTSSPQPWWMPSPRETSSRSCSSPSSLASRFRLAAAMPAVSNSLRR